MVTAENSRLNVRTASSNVRAALGLPDDPKEWSYEQRTRYNVAIAERILLYPASFTPETLATAAAVVGRRYVGLEDASFDWGEFGAETAADSVPVLTGFSNKLLIIAGLAAVAYFSVLAARTNPRRA